MAAQGRAELSKAAAARQTCSWMHVCVCFVATGAWALHMQALKRLKFAVCQTLANQALVLAFCCCAALDNEPSQTPA